VEKALHREQILPWEVPEVISNLYRNIRELPLGAPDNGNKFRGNINRNRET
jgi:hypothetical protein